ncbi:MAG: hypothetical protein K2H84_07725, partial [Paramuribaculum sp.]|nr:hypothetical protein [Paramuribaculum sp.]
YNGFARYKSLADKRAGIASAPAKILAAPKDNVNEKVSEKQNPEVVPVDPPAKEPATECDDTPIIYKVQFYTSGSKLPADSPKLKGISDAEFYRDGGGVKYTTGNFLTEQDAKKRLAEVRKKFPDAFIIKTLAGKRIK